MFEELFDFENDFTEEEEAVFSPKGMEVGPSRTGAVKTVVAKTGTGKTIEMKEKEVAAKYKAGVTVTKILKEYSLSTGRLYDILKTNNIPLRGSSNHVGSTKPALVEKRPIPTDKEYIFTSDVANRYGLTPGQVRCYCQVLEGQGYEFNRIQRGQSNSRIFNDKDITILDQMVEELRIHSMVQAATLSLYNHDVQPPKVNVKLEGETLYINIERTPQWTADEINVVINLKEEV
jgi:hypothetical protein